MTKEKVTTIKFSGEVLEALERIQEKMDVKETEALRRAVSVLDYLLTEIGKNSEILLKDSAGEVTRLNLLGQPVS